MKIRRGVQIRQRRSEIPFDRRFEPRLTGVTVRLYNSRGTWVGADEETLSEIKPRDADVLPGQPIPLRTTDVSVGIAATWRANGSVMVRQRDPLPVSVLAVAPEIDIGKG